MLYFGAMTMRGAEAMTDQSILEAIVRLDGMLFIDGAFQRGAGDRLPVENPATCDVIGHIAAATAPVSEAAVQSARRAFRPWAAERSKTCAASLHRLGALSAAGAASMSRP